MITPEIAETFYFKAKNNFDECQQNLYILKYFKETDTNSIEQKIASNLDKYVERYGDELMSLEISMLYNIFNSENKKLSKQNEVYELIKKHYAKNKNDNIFVLISCLDGKSLNESNLKDSILEAKKRMGFHQKIIKFEEIINEQKRLLDEQNRKIDELKQQQVNQIKELSDKVEQMMIDQKEKIDEKNKIIQNNQQQANQIKEINEKFDKILRSQNEKIEEISKKIEEIQKSNFSKEKQYVFYKDISYSKNSKKGIIDYFRNNSKINEEIKITASSVYDSSIILNNLFNIENKLSVYTKNELNSWFCFEFQKSRIIISNYLMKSNNSGPNNWHPKSWVLEGSNDNKEWLKIDEQNNCSFLNGDLISHLFDIQNHEIESNIAFKYLRIRQTSVNWAGNRSLDFCSIEFFGKIVQ